MEILEGIMKVLEAKREKYIKKPGFTWDKFVGCKEAISVMKIPPAKTVAASKNVPWGNKNKAGMRTFIEN